MIVNIIVNVIILCIYKIPSYLRISEAQFPISSFTFTTILWRRGPLFSPYLGGENQVTRELPKITGRKKIQG